jgi:hypothetical protein
MPKFIIDVELDGYEEMISVFVEDAVYESLRDFGFDVISVESVKADEIEND